MTVLKSDFTVGRTCNFALLNDCQTQSDLLRLSVCFIESDMKSVTMNASL